MKKILGLIIFILIIGASLCCAQILKTEPNISSWQGPWVSTTAYTVGEAVSYNGLNYICTVANTGVTPLGSNDWLPLNIMGFVPIPVVALGTPAASSTTVLSGQVDTVTIANACTLQFPTGTTNYRSSVEIWITNGGAATITWSPVPTWATGSLSLATVGTNVIYCESLNGWSSVTCWQME